MVCRRTTNATDVGTRSDVSPNRRTTNETQRHRLGSGVVGAGRTTVDGRGGSVTEPSIDEGTVGPDLDTDDRVLRELWEGPVVAPMAVSPSAERYVGRIALPPTIARRLSRGATDAAGDWSDERLPSPVSVYYLYGDERRAVRRFVAENERLVRAGLATNPEEFPREWDDVMRSLLREEWQFAHGDG
jgi:hypothetical protein